MHTVFVVRRNTKLDIIKQKTIDDFLNNVLKNNILKKCSLWHNMNDAIQYLASFRVKSTTVHIKCKIYQIIGKTN